MLLISIFRPGLLLFCHGLPVDSARDAAARHAAARAEEPRAGCAPLGDRCVAGRVDLLARRLLAPFPGHSLSCTTSHRAQSAVGRDGRGASHTGARAAARALQRHLEPAGPLDRAARTPRLRLRLRRADRPHRGRGARLDRPPHRAGRRRARALSAARSHRRLRRDQQPGSRQFVSAQEFRNIIPAT